MPPTPDLSRRSALLGIAGPLALPARLFSSGVSSVPSAASTRVLIVVTPGGPGEAGAELGITEARHAWELLGRDVAFQRIDLRATDDPRSSPSLADAARACVVTALAAPALAAPATEALRELRALQIDAGAHTSAACDPLRFTIGPASTRDAGAAPLLWHESLERFGARQLNDRFRARFGRGMDAPEWAAWFAVKVASESCLRTAGDPASLKAHLESERAGFDGHKGRLLRFDASHRLDQPLYVLGAGGATELPDAKVPGAPCAAGRAPRS